MRMWRTKTDDDHDRDDLDLTSGRAIQHDQDDARSDVAGGSEIETREEGDASGEGQDSEQVPGELSPREIVDNAITDLNRKQWFKKLKADPFECPCCKEPLLIDRCTVKVDAEGFTRMTDIKIITRQPPAGTSSSGAS